MKKTAAQLDREIAEALASSAPVTISVHTSEDDDRRASEEHYTVSDDGGEFDDASEMSAPDVQGDIDERRDYYRERGRRVVLDIPRGRDWT